MNAFEFVQFVLSTDAVKWIEFHNCGGFCLGASPVNRIKKTTPVSGDCTSTHRMILRGDLGKHFGKNDLRRYHVFFSVI